ncbi:transketolase [Niabella aurantiaca]|uniref:transketolase n=1 Tax=Niabella aurantiaca TaxID=379900 RepID=UPI000375A530|nr:transketolase [Niabella aurantiaca]
MTSKELKQKSVLYRKNILKYIVKAKAGHTGGSLSCTDILNVLYNEIMNVSPGNFSSPDRDRYIQSKGHTVEALFVVLADKGFFPEEDLETLCRYQSHYIGHPTKKVNGVEQNTGALGHGLPIAVGTAIAGKLDEKNYRVFTLMGDGEMPEGSNWEAALSAAHYKLDNLCAIVDKNSLQITAPTAEVCNTDPLDEKWKSFGWAVREVDGNDVDALKNILKALPFEAGKPSFLIAGTTKGKGVSYMENVLKWHHGVPSAEEYDLAVSELNQTLIEL